MIAARQRAHGGIQATRMTITPDMAKDWLDSNTNNRKLKPRTVAKYASAIGRGEWQYTGEAIKFAIDGHLLDGQHRLAAVVKSKSPIDALVIFGLPCSVFSVLDTGSKRTASDALRVQGEKNCSILGSAIRWSWLCHHNQLRWGSRITNDQALSWLQARPGLRESVSLVEEVSIRRLVSPSIMAALHDVAAGIDKELADSFFRSIGTGANLAEGSPAYTLRRWLERVRYSRGDLGISRWAPLVATVRAWNAARAGRQLHKIQWVVRKGSEMPRMK